MFQLTSEEFAALSSQFVISKLGRDHQQKLRPLLEPPPKPPKPEIGFHVKEETVSYRIKRK